MNFTTLIFLIILIFPIYYFSKKILEVCELGSKISQRNISMLLAIFLSPVLFAGIIGIKLMVEDYSQRYEFSQEIWFSRKAKRHRMTNHIIESKMLIGKNKKEVIEVLGNDFFSDSPKHIGYRIGFVQKLYTKEPFILNIHFVNEKVSFVHQDIDIRY